MTETTTTPTTVDPLHDLGQQVRNVGVFLLFVALLAALVALVVWAIVSRRRPAGDRWEHRPDGSIRGPWWARRRIRSSLAPLVHRAASSGRRRPATVDAWHDLAERQTARFARQCRRVWPDLAAALAWPSRFDHATLELGGRTLYAKVGAGEVPEPVKLTAWLAELGVLARTSHAFAERLDDQPNTVRVTLVDATSEPMTTDATNPFGLRRIRIVTGLRWWSLFDPDVTWAEPVDAETDEPEPARGSDRIIGRQPLPDRRSAGSRARRGTPGPETTGTVVPDIRDALVLYPAQLAALRAVVALAEHGRPAGPAAVAAATGRDPSNTGRTLVRLYRLGLLERGADGRSYTPTDSGRTAVSDTEGTPSDG